MKSAVFWFCFSVHSLGGTAELVGSCDLGRTMRVDVIRDERIADTHVYYLRQHGKKQPFFRERNISRGSSVQVDCVGQQLRALVVTGEFTSNFRQGFVIRANPKSGRADRFDFAEKSRPVWLYLALSESTVVIPTNGYGESNKKYVAYRHTIGSNAEPAVIALDELPDQGTGEMISLSHAEQNR